VAIGGGAPAADVPRQARPSVALRRPGKLLCTARPTGVSSTVRALSWPRAATISCPISRLLFRMAEDLH
jgi:hypothetical protein